MTAITSNPNFAWNYKVHYNQPDSCTLSLSNKREIQYLSDKISSV
jgi:hypothetical protein